MRYLLILLALPISSTLAAGADDGLEFFEKQVRPLLSRRCFECHSEKSETVQGGLRLDTRAAALSGGDSGPAVVAGEPNESWLIKAIRYDGIYQMPPKSKLPEKEIATLVRWVEMGAPWPEDPAAGSDVVEKKFDLAARRDSHWAWQPVHASRPPAVEETQWPRDPIDRFILSRLESEGLAPNEEAAAGALLRRVYFDLIGLPPTADALRSFVNDRSPDALARQVDRLLASPRFGERWGRHWLDLVRYADSRGHEFDYDVPNAWQYRDYVIRALNADVPYDQFVREHFAGDLLPQPRMNPQDGFNESILGTGFWFLGEWVHSPVDIRQDEADRFDNMIDVAGKTFFAMTVACARCHDHKFDAISTKDYYSLMGFLQSSSYRLARFDSLEHNGEIARQLASLRSERLPKIAKAAADSFRPVLEDLDKILLAARSDAISLDGEIAELVSLWKSHLKSVQDDQSDPFYYWSRVGEKPISTAQRLASKCRGQLQDARAAMDPADVVIDFRDCTTREWRQDGWTFGAGPVRPGDLVCDDELKVATVGGARRDLFWNDLTLAPGAVNDVGRLGGWVRAGRTIRTPTFEITSGQVHYLVKGAGHAYAVVDSHRVNQGPLHGALIKQWDQANGERRWISQNLSDYVGHRAHLEFSPHEDGPLEIVMVVQGDQPPADSLARPSQWMLELFDSAAASATPDATARKFREMFLQANEQLASGKVGSRDAALLVDWMLEHEELLTTTNDEHRETVKRLESEFIQRRGQLADQVKRQSRLAPAMWDGSGENERVFIRGNHKTLGDEAPRSLLAAMSGEDLSGRHGSGRLALVEQFLRDENPFASRVMVNRLWSHLFGRGIVPSVDNFGALGQKPSHPLLLDWLANDFSNGRWSIKRSLRRMALSSAYRMSSRPNQEASRVDPTNALLHRMRLRRLEGEVIRDGLLAVSGRLSTTMYGKSVPVHLTPFMQGRGRPSASGPLDGDGRRSIYIAVRRNFLSPMFLAFDTPSPFSTVGRRNSSNVPGQALTLLNDPLLAQQSKQWAERILSGDARRPEARINRMFLTALSRNATLQEVDASIEFLKRQSAHHGLADDAWRADARPWADLCHVLFNVKDFIFLK